MSGDSAETDPAKPRRHLVRVDDQTVEIVTGEHRLRLQGETVPRIWDWHTHMLTHGEAEAGIYLAGLVHGLEHATLKGMQALIDEIAGRTDRSTIQPLGEP